MSLSPESPSFEERSRQTARSTSGCDAAFVRSARASGWDSPPRQARWREATPSPSVSGCTVGPEAAASAARSSLHAGSAPMRPG